ncbi:MAG TPA: hypothetical protein VFN35_07665 [Ktedonobacteraceae bacterium]|nr:hypothetical protein [Ktedonobacteraceae bacterium]
MSDTITQTRLSLRLDSYLSEYRGMNISNDHLGKKEWDTAWQIAAIARANGELTPAMVDDVRLVLNKF